MRTRSRLLLCLALLGVLSGCVVYDTPDRGYGGYRDHGDGRGYYHEHDHEHGDRGDHEEEHRGWW